MQLVSANTHFIIFALVFSTSSHHLAGPGVPYSRIARILRHQTTVVTNHTASKTASLLLGEILKVVLNKLTAAPIAIAKEIGFKTLKTPANKKNIVNLWQDELKDFKLGARNEDVHLHFTGLINKYGYPLEEHYIQTNDGYNLTAFRIPPRNSSSRSGSVVLLMHGLFGSADDWILAGPSGSLAYMLADAGHDVWLGNARGCKHSRRHARLSPAFAKFWDFSWDEIGRFDLPAIVDHILHVTRRPTLKYVGHSQGTTAFFVMCSELPLYNDKIEIMYALSPVAWMSHVYNPLVRLMSLGNGFIHAVIKIMGVYEFFPDKSVTNLLRLPSCDSSPLSEIVCSNIIFLICGYSFEQLNVTNLPVILGHLPSGASAKQVAHYGQGVVTGEFQQYDYGVAENLRSYGTATPPSYPVHRITAPVSLIYSDNDWLSSPADVHKLRDKLSNVVDYYKIPLPFNHVDFLWGKDAKNLIFNRMLRMMEQLG